MKKEPVEHIKPEEHTLKVPDDRSIHKKRVDRWICEHVNLTRSVIQRLLTEGKITVNNEQVRPSTKLRGGEIIKIVVPPPPPTQIIPQNIPLDIVAMTDSFIVVNKPVGMVVHPGKGNHDGTLANGIVGLLTEPFEQASRPGIVHRIDKGTSGLLVVARCEHALQELQAQFAAHTVKRKYWALVWGKTSNGVIDKPLGRDSNNRIKFAVRPDGKRAVTHYRTLGLGTLEHQAVSLIECQLETGRTHQIRVHMQSIGHPLVGDPLYGRRSRGKWSNPLKSLDHQLLHAWLLGFELNGEQHMYQKEIPLGFEHWLLKSNIIKSKLSSL